MKDAAAPGYGDRLERFRSRIDEVRARSSGIRRLRVAAFLGAVVAFLLAERTQGTTALLLAGAGGMAGLGFAHLVRRHRSLQDEEGRLDALMGLNREALARVDRRWDELPPAREASGLESHPYARDLDVVGSASLERLFNTVSTGPGARTLREWLLDPADPEEVRSRRGAVVELGGRVELRQELAARARLSGLGREDPTASFLEWAGEESWFPGRRWLLWTARLVPVVTLILLVLHLVGSVERPWWAGGIVAGFVFAGAWGTGIGRVLDRISAGQGAMGSYAGVLELLEGMEASSERLATVREGARAGAGSASKALSHLERWVTVADVRHNHLLHGPLQVLFFWDAHVLWLLERWRRRNGGAVRIWLEALGEAEALSALSVLVTDHRDWSFAEIMRDPVLEARGLGHPLLPSDACVRNDVRVGPPGTFLLLTGSNMAGKSTLLRALGLNAVLARAGAPACAERLHTGVGAPVTSMRTEDSLSEGVSGFMAELRRVSLVVEATRTSEPGATVLYLLDEPLQGTNEAERRTALRTILDRLLVSDAIGAVATHDLRLHRTERLEEAAHPVHFTSSVERTNGELRLRFDYRLRKGPATSTNALDLLRMVGLAEGAEEP